MQKIHLKPTVGTDGVLRVQMPPECQNRALEAIAIWKAVPKSEFVTPQKAFGWQLRFFDEVIGGWVGEPLKREEQGSYEVREELF